MHRVKLRQITWLWWISVITLLLLIVGLRTHGLLHVPPGLTHDEASNGHDSAAILSGVHHLYFPVGYGHEPLYNYSVAAMTLLLGRGIYTLRITTVLWSLAQVILTTALARRWWGHRAALGVLAAYAVSFWALMMSRVGLRAPTLPPLITASVLIYDRALTRTKRHDHAPLLAGVLLGLGFYTYMASRGIPLLYLGYLVALLILNKPALRRAWKPTLIVLTTAALVGLPLFLLLRANPELESRIEQLGGALQALSQGNLGPLIENIQSNAPMLFWRADPRWLYNIAGRPLLEPLLAGLFLVGSVRAFASLRRRRSLLTLLWLAVGLAPALVVTAEYNTLHAIAAMPAIFLLVGLGIHTVTGVGRLPAQIAIATILSLGLGITAVRTAKAYFSTWAFHRDVRVAYHHHVVTLGRHLDLQEVQSPIVVSTLYPGEFHDPYTMEVTRQRQDLSMRWCDARYALIVPQTTSRLYIGSQTAPREAFAPLLDSKAQRIETLKFEGNAIPAQIQGYQWYANQAWTSMQLGLAKDTYAQNGDPSPDHPHRLFKTPINFDGVVTLTGYTIRVTDGEPSSYELLTAWQVTRASNRRLLIFSHLLSSTGKLMDQVDRLDAPSWQWQPGDRFVQWLQLDAPEGTSDSACSIALGVYAPANLNRLPLKISERSGAAAEGKAPPPTRVLIPCPETDGLEEP